MLITKYFLKIYIIKIKEEKNDGNIHINIFIKFVLKNRYTNVFVIISYTSLLKTVIKIFDEKFFIIVDLSIYAEYLIRFIVRKLKAS